jgi:hypothetical protein
VTGASVPLGGRPTPEDEDTLDDFNRPDGPLGPDSTVHDGTFEIVDNAAQGSDAARATFNDPPGDGSRAEAYVATNGTAPQYTGLLLNYGAGVDNLFLKVEQQNGSGMFEYGGCFTGNNETPFGLGLFELTQPFAFASMEARFVVEKSPLRKPVYTTFIFMDDLLSADGAKLPPQSYVCEDAPPPEGTGIGILGSGGARLDDFGADWGQPDMYLTHVRLVPLPGPELLLGIVRLVDEFGPVVAGATVEVEWVLPNGLTLPQVRDTNANGLAFPIMLGRWPGEYHLCVTNVSHPDYRYAPEDNLETCATITLP